MENTNSVPETARKLGVATVTVYQWIQNGRIQVIETRHGLMPRYRIEEVEIERMRERIYGVRPQKDLGKIRPGSPDHKWVSAYRSILGHEPFLLGKYMAGMISFEEMREQSEAAFREMMSI